VGSRLRQMRRAAGLTGYEYQRDLKRQAAAKRRAERPLTVTRGPNSPPPIPPRVYRAEDVELTIGGETFATVVPPLADPGASPIEPAPRVLVIDDPLPRRRLNPLQLIAMAAMFGLGSEGRRRG
jgi:hypothetical protein